MSMLKPLPQPIATAIRARGGTIKPVGEQWMVSCPNHDDSTPSVAIKHGNNGGTILYCLAGETRIITKHGTKPIAELAGTTQELLVPTTNSAAKWVAAPIHSFGTQPLMAVTLQRGKRTKTIYATPEHRWYTQRRNEAPVTETTTNQLQPGDRLKPISIATPNHTPSPIGIAHGITYGDGARITKKDRCTVDLHGPKQILQTYFPHAEPKIIRETPTTSGIRINKLPNYFKELPPLTENSQYLFGFLQGYFATDGSVEGENGPAVITSTKPEAIQTVRDIATTLRIITYPIQQQTRERALPNCPATTQTIYKTSFRSLDLKPTFFLLPHHRERWEQRTTTTSQESWKVLNVEPTNRVEEVFCPTIPCGDNLMHAFALEDFITTGNCHGGCTTTEIVAAWGLTIADIMPPDSTPKPAAPHNDTWTPEGPASDIYDYTDEHGELLYQVMRVPKPGGKKTFRQRRPDTTTRTGWAWNLKGVRRVPYRLPQTLEAIQTGKTVWICEGERDVHTLETHGHTATCNSGGANKWDPEFCDWFADGARVIIIADADQPGREHARKIYHQMQEVGANVTLTEPAEGCKDITDHLNAGLPIGDLLVIDQPPVPDYGLIDIHTLIAEEEEPYHWLIPDLIEHNERLMITGGEGSGKRVCLSTRIMTPTGWTTMGNIKVGDLVIDRDGNPTPVTWKSDIQHVEAHRVECNDGTVILACADHQWITQTISEREREKKYADRAAKRAARVAAGLPPVAPRGTDQTHLQAPTEGIRTTRQIMDTLISNRKNRATNHTIKAVAPLNLPHADLPIDPYTLGVWLGDGDSKNPNITLHNDDKDHIIKTIEANGHDYHELSQQHHPDGTPKYCARYHIHGLRTQLRTVGLLGNKHIPLAYLRASIEQRLALLQGLMDTDGYAPLPTDTGRRGDPGGNYEIIVSTKYGPLGDNVMELLRTLGIIPRRTMRTPTINGEEHSPVHRIAFQTALPVFTVPRKSTRMRPPRTDQTTNHYITRIVNTRVLTPMQCIQTGTHTYTVEHIPTHNSTMLRQIAIMTAAGIHPFPHTQDRTIKTFDPKKVLWVDAENSRRQNRRQLTPLYHLTQSLGQQIPPGYFTIALRPEGLDLHKGDDHVWLQERVAITKPDLLIIGPWYRLFNGDPNDETAARQVIQVIDTLRAQYNFTTIMEAHSPHQPPGAKHRPLRPIGSSILLRWPEYGYGLQFHTNPDTQLTDRSYADFIPWRGDRDERSWPAAFTRGTLDGDPPWLATDPKTPDDPRPERDHQTRRDTQYAYTRGNGGTTHDIKPRMADQ